MSDVVIQVDQLGKKYDLGVLGTGTLKHDLNRWWHRLRGKHNPMGSVDAEGSSSGGRESDNNQGNTSRRDEIWALRNISFEVNQGEILGVIGRNGAGKSTLLKILSRTTAPTIGEIRVKGRIASLLEVGTGFHPDLTGRENIYLNGAILGMSRNEIRKKFDEIVDFSEVDKFIDTPVKRYSSGMYVRLAFAVAAHLEPEILIIDEVLAVGDAQFQKKCLGKMENVANGGRTVLFVSHNMNAVESLCRRVIHLERGALCDTKREARQAIAHYLKGDVEAVVGSDWQNQKGSLDNPYFTPARFYLADESGKPCESPHRNDIPLYVYIEGVVKQSDPALNIGYGLYDEENALLFWSTTTDAAEDEWPLIQKGRNYLRSQLPVRVLNQGSYRVELLIALYHRQWISCPGTNAPAIGFAIQGGLSDSPYWMEKRPGILAPVCKWTLNKEPAYQVV